MAIYVIAGEADSEMLAECEYIGQKLEKSAPNVSVRVVIKDAEEWPEFLKNVRLFTVDGRLIGDKSAFKRYVRNIQVLMKYGLKSDLKKQLRKELMEANFEQITTKKNKLLSGPTLEEIVREGVKKRNSEGKVNILDGFFERKIDNGMEYYVKISNLLTPNLADAEQVLGVPCDFLVAPEVMERRQREMEEACKNNENILVDEQIRDSQASPMKTSEADDLEEEEEDEIEGNKSMRENAPSVEQDKGTDRLNETTHLADELLEFEVSDKNFKRFLKKFKGEKELPEDEYIVPIPSRVNTVPIPEDYVICEIENGFLLAIHPFPLIPGQLFIFPGESTEYDGRYNIRDSSLMYNWLKLISVPPQTPAYKPDESCESVQAPAGMHLKSSSSTVISERGYSTGQLALSIDSPAEIGLKLRPLDIKMNHILTEIDWVTWHSLIKALGAVGFYQWLPYNSKHYNPLTVGVMNLLLLPLDEIPTIPLLFKMTHYVFDSTMFTIEGYDFDHVFHKFTPSTKPSEYQEIYISCMNYLNIKRKDHNCGMNILITKNWVFFAPIYRSFNESYNNHIYLDPLSYLGILHLPVIEKKWPQTAGIDEKTVQLIEALKQTSEFISTPDTEILS